MEDWKKYLAFLGIFLIIGYLMLFHTYSQELYKQKYDLTISSYKKNLKIDDNSTDKKSIEFKKCQDAYSKEFNKFIENKDSLFMYFSIRNYHTKCFKRI